MNNRRFVAFGECMAELSVDHALNARVGFSGDVYNCLVYAKRWFIDLETMFVTGLGDDQLSKLMIKDAQSNQIDLSLSVNDKNHNIGIYTISTNDLGESLFDYWRRNSAATQYFNLISEDNLDRLIKAYIPGSVFYFSGISLAIYEGSDKDKLLFYITKLKNVGYKIAFDPNYRPRLWNNISQAIDYISQCYQVADIILPGLEDHQGLFGHQSISEIEEYCSQFENTEVIIKGGLEGMLAISATGTRSITPFNPALKQIDSTAAGDSFAGIYLAARLNDYSISASVKLASEVARLVVTHKGAIVSKSVFTGFRSDYLNKI